MAAAVDRFDEGAIDLDLVEWKGTEVRERRVARTKVVHSYADTQHLDSPKRRQCAAQVADERRFGDLQFQLPGGEAGLEENLIKTARSRVFVLDFDGDIRASAVEHLREEISRGGAGRQA